MGVGIFSLSLIGTFTRPGTDLAAFWPANAFMLGMLVRFPRAATVQTVVCCLLGYVLADLIADSPLLRNLMLNTGNLLAVAGGYVVLRLLSSQHRRLRTPDSVLYVLAAMCSAALCAATFGSMADPVLFGGTPMGGFTYWGATELVNMIAFLPMLLALPSREVLAKAWQGFRNTAWNQRVTGLLPVVALVMSCIGGVVVGGPGAVAFPVPMLLWCAVSYPVFVTACLCFCYVVWALLSISTGVMNVAVDFASRDVLLSTRVGVALVALAPLAVASAMSARNDAMLRLHHIAHHDPLTGLPNRGAFFSRASEILGKSSKKPMAVLMLDIDHFKAVNDTYGHRAGDEVLRHFAIRLADGLRQQDIPARLGGEEFAVLIPDADGEAALAVARRISEGLSSSPVQLSDGRAIRATVSIGMALAVSPRSIDELLAQADEALYRAKLNGRNRVECLPSALLG